MRGEVDRAYALVRPPGHHAGPARTDGFCVFNNTALAAAHCRLAGARRVAVIDIDVHHGNGTQAGFYADRDVLTVSIHMDHRSWGSAHPELGVAAELGSGAAAGTNVNVALPFGCGDRAYAAAFGRVVEPVVERFAPDVLVCAAGFDANQFDPTGRQCVTMSGFHDLGAGIRRLADRVCEGRVVLCQEGGYAQTYTGFCAYAFLSGLLGEALVLDDPLAYLPDVETAHVAAIDETLKCLADEVG
jgi:acetoin utilization deacetylase AcuC-like enzyme